jgi:AhpD family alkylhydroperoxidase
MNKKIEEMIALGVAYGVNCQPCMEYHKKRAIEAGLTKEEMQAAIQVAESVKMGAYKKTKQNAGNLFGDIKEEKCCPVGTESRL